MGKIVQVINAGHYGKTKTIKRWCCFGDGLTLSKSLMLRWFREVVDGEDVITATLLKDNRLYSEAHLYPGEAYDLSKLVGLRIVVRAMELRDDGRGSRLLVEFIATTDVMRRAFQRLA